MLLKAATASGGAPATVAGGTSAGYKCHYAGLRIIVAQTPFKLVAA